MYHDFTYYTPTRIVFGKNSLRQLGTLVRSYGGTKVLLHYGGGSVIRSGLLQRVKTILDEAGISHVELGGVVPNPRLSKVYEGIELCRRKQVDFILAVGGGSVCDSAKGIAYGLANEGDVWDFYLKKRHPEAIAPLGVVITLAATGSEMSNSSVVTKELPAEDLKDGAKLNGIKRGCSSDLGRPLFSVMDPSLTATLPDYQTFAGASDILMHTFERYFDINGTMELTDAVAEGLIRTVLGASLKLKEDPSDYQARADLFWAGSLSHNGLTGCGGTGGDWSCHKLEHELSGMFDVTHGAGLAAIWGTWARYVNRNNGCAAVWERFERFARNIHGISEETQEKTIEAGIRAQEDFFRSIGMPVSLGQLGIQPTEEQIKVMAQRCAEGVGGSCGSMMKLRRKEMEEIYRLAL